MSADPSDWPNQPPNQFATTHWSVVLAAGRSESPQSRAALVRLCETYWYPLYAFARRHGLQSADAHDAIQEFFSKLLECDYLHLADPERGRFRSFLLTALKRSLSKRRRQANSLRRGGGTPVMSLNTEDGERRYQFEPVDDWTAEKLYDRRWALTVLEQVLAQLESEYAEQQKAKLFAELSVYLTPGDLTPSHAEIATRLNMTADAVKAAAYRLRLRYRAALRDEVANTVLADEAVSAELHELLSAIRGDGA
jgi:RNA polymerase sigma-70 factor (ECF subfamily)